MTSIKCRNCGLVSFSTEQVCKRCKSAFPAPASPQGHFEAFQNPPPPPVFHGEASSHSNASVSNPAPPCIKCGSRERIAIHDFVKVYNSPVAIMGIFLGLLPYFLLKLLLRTKHDLTGPFCEPCWARFRNARTYEVLNTLLFFPLLITGIVFSFVIDSEWALLASILMPLFVMAIGQYYLGTLGPKYKRVSSKEVVIDAPYVGEIVYTR